MAIATNCGFDENIGEFFFCEIWAGQGATGEGWGRFSFRLSTMYTDTRYEIFAGYSRTLHARCTSIVYKQASKR